MNCPNCNEPYTSKEIEDSGEPFNCHMCGSELITSGPKLKTVKAVMNETEPEDFQ